MSCVNTSHREFKELSKELDLHPNFLELIVYKYQNSSKDNEGKFPSAEYVRQAIQGKSMTNATEDHLRLWIFKYKDSKTFKSLKEANAYMQEANKYFNKESITVETTRNGEYRVKVEQPYTKAQVGEYKEILRNAPRDSEGRLLAPNGRPSNLTERQYVHVRTKAFLDWFGDWINDPENASKVVDENGEPLVVYHGSDTRFEEFKIEFAGRTDNGDRGRGFYFSPNENIARRYGNTITEVFLNIKNPYNGNQEHYLNRGLSSEDLKNKHKKYLDKIIVKDVQILKNQRDSGNFSLLFEKLQLSKNSTNEQIEQKVKEYYENIDNSIFVLGNFDNTDGYISNINDVKDSYELVIYNSNNVKSATENIGLYGKIEDLKNDIYFQKSNNERNYLRNYYKSNISQRASDIHNTISEIKEQYKGTNIVVNIGDDIGDYKAAAEIQRIVQEVENLIGKYAKVYYYKVDGANTIYELRIKLKSKAEIAKILAEESDRYVNSLSRDEVLSEYARLNNNDTFDEDLAFHIKSRDIPEVRRQIAKRNQYLTEQELDETINFLVELENTQENNAYVKTVINWIKNKAIQLPRDNDSVGTIFAEARHLGIDVQRYASPFDIVPDILRHQSEEVIYPKKGINPYNIPQFHFNRTEISEDGKTLEIFDIDDTIEGRTAVSQAIADTSPKLNTGKLAAGSFSSPWCLGTFNYDSKTGKATRTQSAEHFWNERYTSTPNKQIAFYNGYPVAFNASDMQEEQWWDFTDSPYNTINEISTEKRELVYNHKIENTDNNSRVYKVNSEGYIHYSNKNLSFIEQAGVRFDFFSQSSVLGYLEDRDMNGTVFYSNSKGAAKYRGYNKKDNTVTIEVKRRRDGERTIINLDYSEVSPFLQEISSIRDTIREKQRIIAYEFLSKAKFAPTALINEIYELRAVLREKLGILYRKEESFAENNQEIQNILNTSSEEAPTNNSKKISLNVAEALVVNDASRFREYEGVIIENFTDNTTNDIQDLEYISEEELNEVTEEINSNSTIRKFNSKIIHRLLQSIKDRDLKESYNSGLRKEVNIELEKHLQKILEEFHFETLESDLKEVFGEDVLGATDFLNKVIYLANEGDRNALTGVEEFSHAFVKLMGAIYHKLENRNKFPETAKYSEIRDLIEQTSLYQQVYDTYSSTPEYQNEDGSPNTAKLKEEAFGQALATVILERYENKDKNIFEKIKQWFLDVLKRFKSIFDNNTKLDKELEKMADSILNGTYNTQYLQKISSREKRQLKLQDFAKTITDSVKQDGGIGLSILQDAVATNGFITGSLAYRTQTPLYRKSQDSLHDIDIVYPLSVHNWHIKHPYWRATKAVSEDRKMSNETLIERVKELVPISQLMQRQPNMHIMYVYPDADSNVVINAIVCEDVELVNKFTSLTGNFASRLDKLTKQERDKIHLVDIFLNKDNSVAEDYISDEQFNLKLTNYKHSFRAKLKYGRAKDIMDYQLLDPSNRTYLIDRTDIMQDNIMMQRKSKNAEFNFKEESVHKRTQDSEAKNILSSYEFYSGAAQGSDTEWANAARELGIEVVEYTSHSWNTLSNTWKNKLDAEYRSVAEELRRPIIDSPLVRRDMMQADKADAIFAIGTVVKPGSRGAKYVNNSNQEVVDGGTGYAVQRGIQRNIPVYVFDQSDNQWKKWDTTNKIFIPTTEPILTPKAATIGTRELQDNGKQAIQSILQKTVDTLQGKQAEEKSTKEEEDAKYYAEQQELWRQLDNLYSTNLMSTSEIGSRARKIAYYISDLITEIQTLPGKAEQMFGETCKGIDFSRLSRADVVRYIGFHNLAMAAKMYFSPSSIQALYKENHEETPRKLISKYRLLQNNWEAMMELALPEFHRVEKFSLKHSDGSIGKFTYESFDIDTYQDEAIIQEQEGSTQEHWQIENRTIEIVGSLSQEMRDALRQCYVLDTNGNKIKDADGVYERVNVKDAVNSILRWTQGSTKLSQMVSKLEAKAGDNPWINQIITRLKDTSSKEADFQSQFFTVFDMHFQAYSVGIKNKDGYSASIVNENPALKSIVDEITAIYNIGKHPMFTLKGIDEKSFTEFKEAVKKISEIKKNNTEEVVIEDAVESITKAINLLGYPITKEEVFKEYNKDTFNTAYEYLEYITKSVESQLKNPNYQPFNFNDKNSILNNLRKVLKPFTDKLEDTTVQTTSDNGKMYQSYITPSYLSKLMLKFKLEGEDFESFMLEEYGKYEWFRFDKEDFANGWRNSLLRDLARNNDSSREVFKHTVLLNFDKKHYMRDMSDMEYLMSILSMYFEKKSNGSRTPAWFRVPMLSNKPSSEFIQILSERGIDYKDTITDNLKLIFDQELSRIQTVLMRNYDESDSRYIKNFDKNGKKFNFLTYMNDYLEGGKYSNTELGKLIQDKVNGLKVDESKLDNLAWQAIKDNMQQKADEILNKWEAAGMFTEAMKIKNLNIDNVKGELENFIWNDTLATINIMELTITDPAFYKDAEDIQKRFAQIHSPGVRGNIEATDYQGNRVSDGYERTIYLTDFDKFKSNIIENLEVVFDRKIAEAKTEDEKKAYEILKEDIIRQYQDINVADAQAYNSPDSYRKKALIFGKWSKEKEAIWEKLKNGEFTYNDLQTVFRPLKPFKYTQMEKKSHVNSTMSNLKVPVQNKNAEYLLVLAGAILQDVDTGKPNILRAIYNIMQETSKDAPTKGIDTVQFTSAVKSGEMGAIDIKRFCNSPGGETLAYETLKQAIYKDGKYDPDAITETLHKTSFEDYCLQQEVPPHFMDHEQIHGSQVRYVTIADLETMYMGQEVTYNLEGRQVKAEEFKTEYEKTIAENIEESIVELSKDLNVYSEDKKTRNLALSKILQKEIDDDPRYGIDLKLACSLDENDNFRIPLGDPIQAKRIEQLINSIIKNRINKQEIAGGPAVQVSNFGTSKQLNIRFKSKKEGETLLQTRAEFKGTDAEYKEYIKENQAGVAYYECFAPAYSQDLFKYFAKEDGTIDIEAIEKTNPELLKMVGYRIPTENKYSCVPMKIVGFLPKEAGEGIMLPYDITLITGSDFDVDKMYIMRKEISIGKNSKGIYTKTPTEGRSYRNNKIVDMTYEVLTHETTADKMLNPGGFTPQKLMGYKVEAYRNNPNLSWEQIDNMKLEDLKKKSYTDKNLTFIDTHLDFYKQNSAAASLIGIFAVANISHMILQDNGLKLNVKALLRDVSLDIMGLKIEDSMEIDSRFNTNQESVSKILGSLVASSADAVKDPVLNLMNINIATVNVLNSLIRLGMPFEKAAMFLSQKCVTDILAEYNKQNLNGYVSLSQVITSRLDKLKKEFGVEASNELFKESIEEQDVIKGLRETTPEMEFKTLYSLNHLLNISKEIGSLSLATRFNSMTSAVGPLIIDNLITENKWDDFSDYIVDSNGNKVVMADIFNMHPILKQFARTYGIANYIFRDFPINGYGFRSLLNALTDNLSVINKDRKLMSKFGDFYLSYLLMENKVIKAKHLDYYINQFPKDFFNEGKTKEEYPDNPFIQAIRLEIDKSSGLPSLSINTTGMRTEDKEALTAGWYDLYKDNEDLAMNLFEYCFFKGGIGFTPKTFMHLLPMQMREKIEGYIDTYNKPPQVVSDIVIDQFVRNNAANNRLVPVIDKDAVLEFTSETTFKVTDEDTIKKMKGQLYVKTNKKPFKMYKQTAKSKDGDFLIYEEVSILGSNGAYLEINTTNINKALISKLDTLEDNDSDNTTSISEPSDTQVNSHEDQETLDLLYTILEYAKNVNSREEAEAKHKEYAEMSKPEQKSMEKTMKNWMAKTMERLGLEHNEEQVDKVYNRMCKNNN